ncbi:DNA binding domain protein, excisionase family [Paraburkholderia atlantica]|uniref:DNA binding domain protein, excisionase family n=1 Tax=Paraburkholderia atlantica TaxID=2654982 RepID=D5WA37_PARAM|nr:helix-turn-helix domain-containing protein [Paraburkholderia atlantica]ADG14259.1 DNA binding domain protein, excisionase family [Paraburkholderia atlantica]
MARTFDIDECADFLKVERKTALKLAQQGELPGARIGRAWVFLEDDVVEYLRVQVRHQMVERQNNEAIEKGFEKARANNIPTPAPLLRKATGGGRRRPLPVLPDLPNGGTDSRK